MSIKSQRMIYHAESWCRSTAKNMISWLDVIKGEPAMTVPISHLIISQIFVSEILIAVLWVLRSADTDCPRAAVWISALFITLILKGIDITMSPSRHREAKETSTIHCFFSYNETAHVKVSSAIDRLCFYPGLGQLSSMSIPVIRSPLLLLLTRQWKLYEASTAMQAKAWSDIPQSKYSGNPHKKA